MTFKVGDLVTGRMITLGNVYLGRIHILGEDLSWLQVNTLPRPIPQTIPVKTTSLKAWNFTSGQWVKGIDTVTGKEKVGYLQFFSHKTATLTPKNGMGTYTIHVWSVEEAA